MGYSACSGVQQYSTFRVSLHFGLSSSVVYFRYHSAHMYSQKRNICQNEGPPLPANPVLVVLNENCNLAGSFFVFRRSCANRRLFTDIDDVREVLPVICDIAFLTSLEICHGSPLFL